MGKVWNSSFHKRTLGCSDDGVARPAWYATQQGTVVCDGTDGPRGGDQTDPCGKQRFILKKVPLLRGRFLGLS